MDGYFTSRAEPLPSEGDWKMMAIILAAATVYE